jgi:hypothetical protein
VDLTPADSDTLDLLDAHLAELHAGRPPDRVRWVAGHPHLAAHLDSRNQLNRRTDNPLASVGRDLVTANYHGT